MTRVLSAIITTGAPLSLQPGRDAARCCRPCKYENAEDCVSNEVHNCIGRLNYCKHCAVSPLEGYEAHEWVCFERALVVRDLFTGGTRTFHSQPDARNFRAALYQQYGGRPVCPPIVPCCIERLQSYVCCCWLPHAAGRAGVSWLRCTCSMARLSPLWHHSRCPAACTCSSTMGC